MKTQLLALVAALASTPALASLRTSEQTDQATALQPAAFTKPVTQPVAKHCGQQQDMMLILHDQSGKIIAAAVVRVTPNC